MLNLQGKGESYRNTSSEKGKGLQTQKIQFYILYAVILHYPHDDQGLPQVEGPCNMQTQ
jgi:hypothetical protein